MAEDPVKNQKARKTPTGRYFQKLVDLGPNVAKFL
jgi:hypothetical protein